MRIIDNKKDYYDYLAGVYGIDSYITYDRRDSTRLHNTTSQNLMDIQYPWHPYLFCPYKNGVEPQNQYDKYKHYAYKDWDVPSEKKEKDKNYPDCYSVHYGEIGLLIGFKLYIIKVARVLENESDTLAKFIPEIVHIKNYDRLNTEYKGVVKPFNLLPPIIIGELSYNTWFPWEKGNKDAAFYDSAKFIINADSYNKKYWNILENPIMADTWIPSIIPATDVWNNISDYLLATKEKPIIDNRTDIEHIESAGFDKKTSFRNM